MSALGGVPHLLTMTAKVMSWQRTGKDKRDSVRLTLSCKAAGNGR